MVTLSGWIYKKREFGKKIFVDLRAMGNREYLGRIIQIVFEASRMDTEEFKTVKKLGQESFIVVSGEFVENVRAPGGVELHVDKLISYYLAEKPYPLAKKKHSPDFLLDVRHLTIRSPRYQRIWLIREALVDYLREWYKKDGWIEVYPPILTFTACEGGATLFVLDYFGQEGYLSQSAQLYLEVMIYSLGKVFSLTPSFRAEKSRTRRHLTEYWHFEAEAAMYRFEDILKAQEESLAYAIRKLLENDRFYEWIKEFRGDMDILNNIKAPFPRITYDEAIQILQTKGINIEWGEDLGYDEEKALAAEFGKPFFIHTYPRRIKAFYCKLHPENPELVLSADLLVPRVGEITTGGAREDDKDKLVERLEEFGLRKEDYQWYIDLRRYGTVPHAGFGLGVERLLMWMLDLENVMEAIPFPRTIRRFYP